MREHILRLLRGQAEVSGQELSQRLHISRAAVAKHVKALRQAGYEIAASPGRGYRFMSAPDTLQAAEIASLLREQQAGWDIHYYEEVPSTTALLRERAAAGAPHGTVLVAESQRAGEGRLERAWYSPPGVGLWLSFLLRPPLTAQLAQTMTLLTACAVARVLERCGIAVGIKWPNDLLAPDGRKLCGIKSELYLDLDSVKWLVTGLGLNIDNESFPPELADKATSLFLLAGRKLPRAPLAAALLDELYRLYQTLLLEGFEPIRAIWLDYAVSLGQTVRVSNAQGEYYAVARGLDENGYLLVERAGRMETVTSGDILLAELGSIG